MGGGGVRVVGSRGWGVDREREGRVEGGGGGVFKDDRYRRVS